MARPSSAVLVALTLCLAAGGCDDDPTATPLDGGAADAGAADPGPHAAQVQAMWALLPASTRGVLALDLPALHAAGVLPASDLDPAVGAGFDRVRQIAPGLLAPGAASGLLLGHSADPSEGLVVLATLLTEATTALGEPLIDDGTSVNRAVPLFRTAANQQVAVLPGGIMAVGSPAGVRAVVEGAAGAPRLAAFRQALSTDAPFSFVYGLRPLLEDGRPATGTLLDAAVVSGALSFSAGAFAGEVRFHTADAPGFVDTFNALNAPATQAEPPLEAPLTAQPALADGLGQVVVPVPTSPLRPTPEQALTSRNLAKKLFVGVPAHRYAEGVADPGNPVWVAFAVKSAADGGEPPSPSSVFVRWAFRDEAAVQAFEANELPAGFRLTPTRFLERDPEGGAYFLALNLYNSGGGLVSGARAEWNVFVRPPAGADPEADTRPRFMVVDALAQAVSADPVNLVTPAEPMRYAFDGDDVVAQVDRLVDGAQAPVFSLRFPQPDPATAEAARFTRELAAANDYIYWGHGVYDRTLYNATVFNHDALLGDLGQVQIDDRSRWAQYLAGEPLDVVYYQNSLAFLASPMANLRSELLDLTPEWREQLLSFKTNGHQRALMRSAVGQLFRGAGDALMPRPLPHAVPAVSHHFTVTDPAGLAALAGLPSADALRPIRITPDEPERPTLSLAVYQSPDANEGLRAEWRTYVNGRDGRPQTLILGAHTEHPALDPMTLLGLPSAITHAPGGVATTLQAPGIQVRGTLAPTDTVTPLSLDWIEAGDRRCWRNGVCDAVYYDAQTLDRPVRVGQARFEAWQTPWDATIEAAPRLSFLRDAAQPQVVAPWQTVKVPVPELPFSGLEGATHTLSGEGTLSGRETDVVDSAYTYTGDAVIEGDTLRFAMDQQIDNLLGEAHIFTTGSVSLATGMGSQTVVGCLGPALMCADVVAGSTALYTAQNLDASDQAAITWEANLVVDLGGSFGLADSASSLSARAR